MRPAIRSHPTPDNTVGYRGTPQARGDDDGRGVFRPGGRLASRQLAVKTALVPPVAFLIVGVASAALLDAPSGDVLFGDGGVWIWLVVAPFVVVGTLISVRHPGNAEGWLLTAVGLAAAMVSFFEAYAVRA